MIALYFALAFGITWLVQLPAVLAQYKVLPGPAEQYMPLAGFGLFGPMIAAFITARVERGKGGAGALWRSLWVWRVSPLWYLVALALPTVGYLAARAAAGPFTADAGPWHLPPENAPRVAAMFIAPIGEEIGWRGYALPRLQERYGRLPAALMLGALWGLWHLMMYLMVGLSTPVLIASILILIPGSVYYSWVYNRAGQSALLAILTHMGTHLNNPNQLLPGKTTPFWINAALYTLFSVAALADRGAWRRAETPPARVDP